MTIKETFDIIHFLIKKERSGYFSPEEICLALDKAQTDYWMKMYREWEVTGRIGKNMLPFQKSLLFNNQPYSASNVGGTDHSNQYGIVIPSDHQYTISVHKSTPIYKKLIDAELIEGGARFVNSDLKSNRVYRIEIDIPATGDMYLKYGTVEVVPNNVIQDGDYTVEVFHPATDNETFEYELGIPGAGTQFGNMKVYEVIRYESENTPIKQLDKGKLSKLLSNEISKPTLDLPYYVLDYIDGEKTLKLYPQEAMWGELQYFRKPAKPVYAYTIVDRTETHDPNTSVDLEWQDIVVTSELIPRTLEVLGVITEDQTVTQYSQQNKIEQA